MRAKPAPRQQLEQNSFTNRTHTISTPSNTEQEHAAVRGLRFRGQFNALRPSLRRLSALLLRSRPLCFYITPCIPASAQLLVPKYKE